MSNSRRATKQKEKNKPSKEGASFALFLLLLYSALAATATLNKISKKKLSSSLKLQF
jgi:hypothetical protein